VAASSSGNFDAWLSEKLQNLNAEVDLEVFVSYISGILESEPSEDEQIESLSGILAEISEEDLDKNCKEIVTKWKEFDETSGAVGGAVSIDATIAGFMEQQKQQVIQTKELSKAEKVNKAAILAQYAHVSDGEGSDIEEAPADKSKGQPSGSIDDFFLAENVNTKLVIQRERDQRDKNKTDSASKKQNDKEEREKQKNKAQDRKDAEKKRTQKGEKRR
jgi:hypothetical protein